MTIRELIKAIEDTGLHPDSEVRASMDEGALDTCGIKEVAAGMGVILLNLDVDEIG